MDIITGKIQKAKKVVVYGPEGIGKSTFAAQFPNAVFIDTEGSTNGMNVARTPKPTSWEILQDYIRELKNQERYKTIVIDTIDWAEQLCIKAVCDKNNKKGIEDFGYGKGYVYEKEEFGKLLNLLQEVVDSGINVVLTAHAQLKKFEQPDEMGAYDRWELKLGQKTGSQISPLVKEWADMVLFANYKTYAVATDKDGKKFKAQGGERMMYTAHHPCWDAKNRDGLPDTMPFEYSGISHLFVNAQGVAQTNVGTISEKPQQQLNDDISDFENVAEPTEICIPDSLPTALKDLMKANKVDESDIRLAVSQKGYFPFDTPITQYPKEFVEGCLIAAWDQVYPMIKDNQGVPF